MVEGSATVPLWTLPPRPGAAVTSMCFHNLPAAAAAAAAAAAPAPNLVLGRSDGSFEVGGGGGGARVCFLVFVCAWLCAAFLMSCVCAASGIRLQRGGDPSSHIPQRAGTDAALPARGQDVRAPAPSSPSHHSHMYLLLLCVTLLLLQVGHRPRRVHLCNVQRRHQLLLHSSPHRERFQ